MSGQGESVEGMDGCQAADDGIVCLKNLVKVREKGGNRFELRVPSLVIHPGEFIALVGESGCGKSTLLDILALVLRPTSADEFTIRLPKQDVSYDVMALSEADLARIRKTKLGYVLQTGGLLSFLTVQENILLPCQLNGMSDVEPRVKSLAERLGIAGQLTKKPQFLSGGQRQRAAIARALAHHPPIVLADEPTAAVDKYTAVDIRNTFKELSRDLVVTLLMVTHDENLIANAADRTFTFEVRKEGLQYTASICIERGLAGTQSHEQTLSGTL
jgi:putative ABC transport system ATP-binding protein